MVDLFVFDFGWFKYDVFFCSYVEECYDIYELEMIGREKCWFWRQLLWYYYQCYGDGFVKEFKGKDKSILYKIQEEMEVFFDELDVLFDDVVDGLRKDWQELKECFE